MAEDPPAQRPGPSAIGRPVTAGGLRLGRHALGIGGALLVVYLLWGSVYVAVKVVVEAAPPLLSIGLRYVVAGVVLAAVAMVQGGWGSIRLNRRTAAGCALLALLLPVLTNGTVSFAESIGVPAGPAALLSAITPISIVILRVVVGDRPQALALVGIVVGFAGLAVLLLGGTASGEFPLGPSLLVVLSANCWAFGSFLTPRIALPADTFATTAYELLFGGVMLTLAGFAAGERVTLDYPTKTWVVLGYLTASSMIAFTAYTWLLANAPISLVSTHAYVNPVVAVALAWLLLSEPLTLPILVGGVVVVAAVALVITEEALASRPGPAEAPPPG